MSETLVKVDNVSKKFCRDLKRSLWYGMKDLGSELLCRSNNGDRQLRKDEFWAVKDVSFELKRGECLGLIGRNGAGKTTLLRMLNGLIKPDKGRIEMRGRVGALIALGAGFNPILTGRENIYANAAVIGLSRKEIDAKIDEIIDFSELDEFIDAPVQSYSSGMTVRLGFSVATALQPEILLLDEVLAVGDTRFQAKCFGRLKNILGDGGSILLVTHTLEHVAHHCNRALLMHKGKLIFDGKTSKALVYYINEINNDIKCSSMYPDFANAMAGENFHHQPFYNDKETRWGDGAATITDVGLMQDDRKIESSLAPGVTTELKMSVMFNADIEEPIYGLMIKSADGIAVLSANSKQLLGSECVPSQKKGDSLQICFCFIPFLDSGEYSISVGIASESKIGIQSHDRRYDSIKLRVEHPLSKTGDVAMNPCFRILN